LLSFPPESNAIALISFTKIALLEKSVFNLAYLEYIRGRIEGAVDNRHANDFVNKGGKLYVPNSENLIPVIKKLKETFRKMGFPVIYANDSHLPRVDKELKLWGDHAIKGTWGAEVVKELEPEASDYVIEKRRYSAFFQTQLDLLLRELGVNEIFLTGVATNVCVLHTAADAFFRGYKVVVIKDATESVPNQEKERWLEYMKTIYGASVKTSEEVLKELARRGANRNS